MLDRVVQIESGLNMFPKKSTYNNNFFSKLCVLFYFQAIEFYSLALLENNSLAALNTCFPWRVSQVKSNFTSQWKNTKED